MRGLITNFFGPNESLAKIQWSSTLNSAIVRDWSVGGKVQNVHCSYVSKKDEKNRLYDCTGFTLGRSPSGRSPRYATGQQEMIPSYLLFNGSLVKKQNHLMFLLKAIGYVENKAKLSAYKVCFQSLNCNQN